MSRALRARLARAVRDDTGSILPLALGYAGLCLVAVLVCVDATSLYLEQKRLDSIADAAALAAADGFTLTVENGQPRAELHDQEVRAQAQALVVASGGTVLLTATTPDGVPARVEVAGTWHPPISTLFVPEGVPLRATATSRTALR